MSDPTNRWWRRSRTWRALAVLVFALFLGGYGLLPHLKGALATPTVGLPGAFFALALAAAVSVGWMRRMGVEPSRLRSPRMTAGIDYVSFNIVLVAVLLELALRLWVPFSDNPLFAPEASAHRDVIEDIRERLEKQKGVAVHGVPFNSLGFRDTEFLVPKPEGSFRIVTLADSFGVIANVPDSHHHLKLVEELLRAAGCKGVDVANLGMSAAGPQHYLAMLREFGLALEPDLVVVYLFLGNDLTRPTVRGAFHSQWDRFLLVRIPARLGRVSGAELEHVSVAPGAPPTAMPVPDYVDDWRLEKPTMSRERFLQIESDRAWILGPAATRSRFGPALRYLHRIRKIARAATGRPLVLVLIPDEMQVNPDLEVAVETLRGIRLDPDRPNRLVAEELSGEEVVLIDLLPSLRRGHSELGRVYHLQNTHWNANGNRVAAAVAVEALLAEPDLIPCGTRAQPP